MVMKAGASNHDKVLVRKMHMKGDHPDIISATLRIKPPQVAAIIAQIEAGTLKIGGGGESQPLPGDQDGQIQTLEPGAAAAILDEQSEAEKKAAEERAAAAEQEAAELREQLANMEAVLEETTAPEPDDPVPEGQAENA